MRCTVNLFLSWGDNVQRIASGLDSGPLVLLSRTGNALVVSPFNQFMAASTVYGDHDNRSTVSWGIMGSVSEIPADFTYWTIMYLSKDGINSVRTVTVYIYMGYSNERLVSLSWCYYY